jgi:deoxyribodipyrimidine photo-lyase
MVNIFWFRRDIRLHDNAGLYHALKEGVPVLPVFIFDEFILQKLDDKADKRVNFIYNEIMRLNNELKDVGSSLLVKYGKPVEIFRELIKDYNVKSVYTNHDYEPYARERDEAVRNLMLQQGIGFLDFKDQAIFEKIEVSKDNGEPYTIFTPYSKKWISQFRQLSLPCYPSDKLVVNFLKSIPDVFPGLSSLGFHEDNFEFPGKEINENLIRDYDKTRDYPYLQGTSQLSAHLRFGTISIRELARKADQLNATFLNELIWREFYMMILWQFPHVVDSAFKSQYDLVRWSNDEGYFEKWCSGQTGYPVVDAGMRELNATGFMHNRTRMITASFLTKNLLIDWRWGEAYFAKKLLDYELASNNGGWQWAAGTGCDAAPYFRVFNPELQSKKFDPQNIYIKKWVPEYLSVTYPAKIVDQILSRNRAIHAYKIALEKSR